MSGFGSVFSTMTAKTRFNNIVSTGENAKNHTQQYSTCAFVCNAHTRQHRGSSPRPTRSFVHTSISKLSFPAVQNQSGDKHTDGIQLNKNGEHRMQHKSRKAYTTICANTAVQERIQTATSPLQERPLQRKPLYMVHICMGAIYRKMPKPF